MKFLRPTHPQITTVQDGKVWLFGVVEHWNAEALGWHVAKRGDRYAAAEAVSMAIRNAFGHVSPSAARGIALRHDHGSAFLAEHFHNQIRFWGMASSYAFVGEPETNGVIERFFRTLKEQIVHGRIYQTIDEVRDAVRDFIARYNTEWLIERLGQQILAELGDDMSRFPTAAHAASGTGICPGNHESAGKRKSGRTRKGNRWLRATLIECARGAVRARDSYLAAQYHRVARRRGDKKAIAAVAHPS